MRRPKGVLVWLAGERVCNAVCVLCRGPKSMKDGGKMEVDCKPDLRSIGKGENRLEGPGENGLPSFGPVKEEPLSVKEEPVSTPASSIGAGEVSTPAAKPDVKLPAPPPPTKTEQPSSTGEASSASASASSPPKPRSNKKGGCPQKSPVNAAPPWLDVLWN